MQNNLSILMNTILEAPVWVQEVVYLDIQKRLKEKLASVSDHDTTSEIYPVFVPEITFKGKKELETHENGLDFNIYKYLEAASNKLRVIDITLNNFWTLEESSKYLAECIRKEFIRNPSDPVLSASVFYLAGEIRIGEYVKRLNKINVEELDDVLRKQKQHNLEHPDERLKTGEIMISMGYVANKDIDKILYTKEEAKKRYILSSAAKQVQNTETQAVQQPELEAKIRELTEQNKKLLAENHLLKDKLRAIFNIQNKNK